MERNGVSMRSKTSAPVRKVCFSNLLIYLFTGVVTIVIIFFVVMMTKQVVLNMKQSSMKTLLQDRNQSLESYDSIDQTHQSSNLTSGSVSEVIELPEIAYEDELPLEETLISPGIETVGSTYFIQSGDTLSGISSYVHYSVDELANYNEIRNVDLIYAGSVLRIPQN